MAPSSLADVISAAELKTRLDLHYADAFAAMTAMQKKATLITTNRDFEKAARDVKIRWLR